MKRILTIAAVIALAGAGIWYGFGGDAAAGKFGSIPAGPVTEIAKIQQNPEEFLGKTVTVTGELARECPTSGCWWYVKDATGEIRADSNGAGFALPLKQTGKKILTTGKVVKLESGGLQIAAQGAEFK